MAEYAFVTEWLLDAPREQVWEEIYRTERWPEWWPSVIHAELLRDGAPNGIGSLWRYKWKTRLPYSLTFEVRTTAVDPPHILEGLACGDLVGAGRWTLTEEQDGTRVRCSWNVRTTKAWMRWLAPLARPVFEWNHHQVMREGGVALARRLRTATRQ